MPCTPVGGIYTIARIYIDDCEGDVMFDFAEFGIPEREVVNGWSTGFVASEYRPIEPASKKADRGLSALKDSIKFIRAHEDA